MDKSAWLDIRRCGAWVRLGCAAMLVLFCATNVHARSECPSAAVESCVIDWMGRAEALLNNNAPDQAPWSWSRYGHILNRQVVSFQTPDDWVPRYGANRTCYLWVNAKNEHLRSVYRGQLPALRSMCADSGAGVPAPPPPAVGGSCTPAQGECPSSAVDACVVDWMGRAERLLNQFETDRAPWSWSRYGHLINDHMVSFQSPDDWATRYRASRSCFLWVNYRNAHLDPIYRGQLPGIRNLCADPGCVTGAGNGSGVGPTGGGAGGQTGGGNQNPPGGVGGTNPTGGPAGGTGSGAGTGGAACGTDPTPPRTAQCNSTVKAGGNRPETVTVDLGGYAGKVGLSWDMKYVKDQILVTVGGQTRDTGCVRRTGRFVFDVPAGVNQATVQVIPNCEGTSSTAWDFKFECPAEGEEQTGGPTATGGSGRQIVADRRSVVQGDIVNLPVSIRNPGGTANVNFDLSYDPSVAVVAGPITAGPVLGGALMQSNPAAPGRIRIGFAGTAGINTTGVVASIPFRAVGAPGAVTPVTPDVTTIANPAGDTLPIVEIAGEIRILGGNTPVPPPPAGPVDQGAACPPTPPPPPPTTPVAGDCDGDGTLTAADALCALKISVGLMPPNNRLDIDQNGDVTSSDARLILQQAP